MLVRTPPSSLRTPVSTRQQYPPAHLGRPHTRLASTRQQYPRVNPVHPAHQVHPAHLAHPGWPHRGPASTQQQHPSAPLGWRHNHPATYSYHLIPPARIRSSLDLRWLYICPSTNLAQDYNHLSERTPDCQICIAGKWQKFCDVGLTWLRTHVQGFYSCALQRVLLLLTSFP